MRARESEVVIYILSMCRGKRGMAPRRYEESLDDSYSRTTRINASIEDAKERCDNIGP